MPDSALVSLCDAMVTHLSAQTLSKSFTVTKDYLPDFEREKLDSTEVTVYPQSQSVAFASRAADQYVYTVNIVIRGPIPPSANPDISAYLYFTQEVTDAVARQILSSASYTGLSNEPAYDLETLNERDEFLSVITVTYLQIR